MAAPLVKRLLYVIPRYARDLMGNQIHTEIIHCWQQADIDVDVLSFDASIRAPEHEIIDGIPVYRQPLGVAKFEKGVNRLAAPLAHYPYMPSMIHMYRQFLETRRYDFAHVETAYPVAAAAALLPESLHPPFAVTLPGADVMAEPEFDYGYARFPRVRALLKLVWQKAALARADSRKIQRQAIALGCPPEKAKAIPYNITDGEFAPDSAPLPIFKAQSRAALLARHSLPEDAKIVLSLSRLHPFKGVEFLVRAAPELLRDVPNAVFLIAGPNRTTERFGDYGAYLGQLASQLGVADRVIQIGLVPHEQVREYYAGSDAVVVPSVSEALNRVAIEAAAVATPSVVTYTTGISEYMVEHGYGLVVEPRSGEAIASALRILFTNERRYQALAASGPAMAEQFRSAKIAAELLEQYAGLVRHS
ncbi:glycosyltransferase family 4 protein [Chloroflexia bacterium SDU3-3]|nr:glycosyltransferase family 4 protein [Chloroflexia bacterium SDU3-3]